MDKRERRMQIIKCWHDSIHGKNDFAEISKNLDRSENNFVGPSK